MNQTAIVVEIVPQDGSFYFIVRDPRTGTVVKIVGSTLELTSFVQEIVDKLSEPSQDSQK